MRTATAFLLAALASCAAPAAVGVHVSAAMRARVASVDASEGGFVAHLHGTFLRSPFERRVHVVARDAQGQMIAERIVQAELVFDGGRRSGVDRARLVLDLPDAARVRELDFGPAR